MITKFNAINKYYKQKHIATNFNQRLLSGLPDDCVECEKFSFHQRWNGIATGQDSLHLLGQNLSNLQQHVFGENIPGKYILVYKSSITKLIQLSILKEAVANRSVLECGDIRDLSLSPAHKQTIF